MAKFKDLTVLTIGHSTHPIEEFVEILKAHGVALAEYVISRLRGPQPWRDRLDHQPQQIRFQIPIS